ncbi:DUF4362 domain-containing protein [Actinoplanes sp. NPDC051513]|uniref:DUF4362 domain-containing protein n=1 Tax=Actinoplanes sp. NPDC051513 TaxID=3363908 RepID=UPI0037B623A9
MRILCLILASFALFACGNPAPAAPAPTPGGTTDCGAFDLGMGMGLPDDAARCLVEAARAGRPARLVVTRSTTEGDPIPVTYTTRADGKVDVVTDSREDAFGQQEITSETCTGPAVGQYGIDFTTCTPAKNE